MTTVRPVFAEVLRRRREEFNARFERTRHVWPQLEGGRLFEFLREAVDPVAVAVSAVDAAAVEAVVSVAYDAALTLVGQRLAGSSGRYPAIGEGWTRVLPACAKHLAPLAHFTLHQNADGSVRLRWRGAGVEPARLESALRRIFGAEQVLLMENLPHTDEKVVQYTSDLPNARS